MSLQRGQQAGGSATRFDAARVYTIKTPRGLTWRPELAQALIMRLQTGHLVFRILAEYASVKWQIADVGETDQADVIRSAVLSVYPDAVIEHAPHAREPFQGPFFRTVIPFYQAHPFIAPIAYPQDLKHYDPLVPLSNLMSDLLPGERFLYSIYVGQYTDELHGEAEKLLKRSGGEMAALHVTNFVLHGIGAMTKTPTKGIDFNEQRYVPELQKVLEEKVNDLLLPSYVFFQIDTPNLDRMRNFAVGFESTMAELRSLNTLIAFLPDDDKLQHFFAEIRDPAEAQKTSVFGRLGEFERARKYGQRTPVADLRQQFRCVFNSRELACLWHVPHEDYQAPNIERVNTKVTRVPPALRDVKSGLRLGVNRFGGISTPIYMLEENRRAHMLIVGKTEMGKSNLMHQMIEHDLRAGRGVAVLDPEGTLVSNILQNSIPPGREKDVVVWDIANVDYPPPLNPLVAPDPRFRHDAAVELRNIFAKLEPSFRGTRMAHDLSDMLETLMTSQDVTLKHIRHLMEDADFRDRFIEGLADDTAWEYWDDVDAMSDAQRVDRFLPLAHRLRELYRGPVLEPVMCHPRNLDFNALISQNSIILISLKPARGAVVSDEQIDMIGSLLVSRFQMAATADAARQPFYLYVDEADRFRTTAIDEMFKRARKRNMHLVLATQFLDSLTGELFNSVMGNVGAVLTFQCGDNDARRFERFMQPEFTAQDLMRLDAHQAVLYMKFRSLQLPAFTLETDLVPLMDADDPTNPEASIRALSKAQHTPIAREQIMEWLSKLYPSKGRRRRKATPPQEVDEAFTAWGASDEEAPDTL